MSRCHPLCPAMGGGRAQFLWKVSRSQPGRVVPTSLHPGHCQAELLDLPKLPWQLRKQHSTLALPGLGALPCAAGTGVSQGRRREAARAGEGLGGQRCAAGAWEPAGKVLGLAEVPWMQLRP